MPPAPGSTDVHCGTYHLPEAAHKAQSQPLWFQMAERGLNGPVSHHWKCGTPRVQASLSWRVSEGRSQVPIQKPKVGSPQGCRGCLHPCWGCWLPGSLGSQERRKQRDHVPGRSHPVQIPPPNHTFMAVGESLWSWGRENSYSGSFLNVFLIPEFSS